MINYLYQTGGVVNLLKKTHLAKRVKQARAINSGKMKDPIAEFANTPVFNNSNTSPTNNGGEFGGGGASSRFYQQANNNSQDYIEYYPILRQQSFGEAFAAARKAGLSEFTFNGKKYTTEMSDNPKYFKAEYQTIPATIRQVYNKFGEPYQDSISVIPGITFFGQFDRQDDPISQFSKGGKSKLTLRQYATEYPVHKMQRGGVTNTMNGDSISSGRWVQVDDGTVTPEYSLPPVTIEAEHPLWSLPGYKDKKNNPNINRYKDQLYNNWRRHNKAGKEYLKRVAGGLSAAALPIGGVPGFILGMPDLAADVSEMIGKPSVNNATELTLDAPNRLLSQIDDKLIPVLKTTKIGKFIAPILKGNNVIPYIGAFNDATTLITGKSAIEHAKE